MEQRNSLFREVYQYPYGGHNQRYLTNVAKRNKWLVQRLKLEQKMPVHNGCVNTICWNSAGTMLLSGSDDQRLVLSNPFSGRVIESIHSGHRANIFSARFLPNTNDTQVISCSGDGMIFHTDIALAAAGGAGSGHQFDCHFGTVYEVETVPQDPHTFLSCGEDGTVRWFDLRIKSECSKEDCKEDILINCRRAVTALTLHPVLPWQVAAGCSDSSVRIYDRRMLGTRATGSYRSRAGEGLVSRFVAPSLEGKCQRITSLAYRSDGGELLASYSSDAVYLFNLLAPPDEKPVCLDTKELPPSKEDSRTSIPTDVKKHPSLEDTPGPSTSSPAGGASPGQSPSKGKPPPIKRLRLRGDWSDTGPNARPERERSNTSAGGGSEQEQEEAETVASTLMQRMSDMLTRWLESTGRSAQEVQGQAQGQAQGQGQNQPMGRSRSEESLGASSQDPDRVPQLASGITVPSGSGIPRSGSSGIPRSGSTSRPGSSRPATEQLLFGEMSSSSSSSDSSSDEDKPGAKTGAKTGANPGAKHTPAEQQPGISTQSRKLAWVENPMEMTPTINVIADEDNDCHDSEGDVARTKTEIESQDGTMKVGLEGASHTSDDAIDSVGSKTVEAMSQNTAEMVSRSTREALAGSTTVVSGSTAEATRQSTTETVPRQSTAETVPRTSTAETVPRTSTAEKILAIASSSGQQSPLSSSPSSPIPRQSTLPPPFPPSFPPPEPSNASQAASEASRLAQFGSSLLSMSQSLNPMSQSHPIISLTYRSEGTCTSDIQVSYSGLPRDPPEGAGPGVVAPPGGGHINDRIAPPPHFHSQLSASEDLGGHTDQQHSESNDTTTEAASPDPDVKPKRPISATVQKMSQMHVSGDETQQEGEGGKQEKQESESERPESESVKPKGAKRNRCDSSEAPRDDSEDSEDSDMDVEEAGTSGRGQAEAAAGMSTAEENTAARTGSHPAAAAAVAGPSSSSSSSTPPPPPRQRRIGRSGPPTGDFQLFSDQNDDDDDSDDDVELMRVARNARRARMAQREPTPPLDRHAAALRLQKLYRARQNERQRQEEELRHYPRPPLTNVFRGHRNARTMIKEATFWGDEFVLSGSDCGHIFIWERATAQLCMMLEADRHVVNCVQPHPHQPMLASSGIDYNIKIWSPLAEEPGYDEQRVAEVVRRNEIMLEETRDTITVPASFMLRMLASLNHFRTAQHTSDNSDSN